MANQDKVEDAKKDYMSGMKYKDIAEKHGVSLSAVKSWASRYWKNKKVATEEDKSCNQNKKVATEKLQTPKKHGAQPGNKNAVGHGAPKGNQNSVGHKSSVPLGNHNAMTHGLYAKYLPPDTLEIADSLDFISPIDILWSNIKIKYASILRAQQIMFVQDKDDLTKELKRQKNGDSSWEEEYELQFAWDKQAAFLNAQSNAMKTLTTMIKQYDELCKSELATEEQKLRIDKLKAEVENLKGDSDYEDSITFTFNREQVNSDEN
ncbi:phage terminase small subunit [Anaerosinus sp.]